MKLLTFGEAGATTITTVQPGESIQSAVYQISAGGVVQLAAGRHDISSAIQINKSITWARFLWDQNKGEGSNSSTYYDTAFWKVDFWKEAGKSRYEYMIELLQIDFMPWTNYFLA